MTEQLHFHFFSYDLKVVLIFFFYSVNTLLQLKIDITFSVFTSLNDFHKLRSKFSKQERISPNIKYLKIFLMVTFFFFLPNNLPSDSVLRTLFICIYPGSAVLDLTILWFANFLFFFFFLVLPLYCYQPISLYPHAHMLSHVTPWTVAHQAPLSMDFSRQEYWSGLPFPSPKFAVFLGNMIYGKDAEQSDIVLYRTISIALFICEIFILFNIQSRKDI